MNLRASAVVLRPRGGGEILDLACLLMTGPALALYARLALMTLLPGLGVCLALRYAFGWAWVVVWLVALPLGALLQGVFTSAVSRLLFAERLTIAEVFSAFRARFGPYLLGLILYGVSVVLSLLFLWPRFAFFPEACLLEGANAGESLARSSRFTRGRQAQVFIMLLTLVAAQAAIVVATELIAQSVVADVLELGHPAGALFTDGGSIYALVGYFLSLPFLATARFLHYIDGRTRADGWDIQLRFMAIAAQAQEARRAAA